jgi:hypothetical protein
MKLNARRFSLKGTCRASRNQDKCPTRFHELANRPFPKVPFLLGILALQTHLIPSDLCKILEAAQSSQEQALGECIAAREEAGPGKYEATCKADKFASMYSQLRSIHVDRPFSLRVFENEWIKRIIKGVRRCKNISGKGFRSRSKALLKGRRQGAKKSKIYASNKQTERPLAL